MMNFNSLYIGYVEKIYPPGDDMNYLNDQFMYFVTFDGHNFTSQSSICIKADLTGNVYDYEDHTLSVGSRVLVMFPRGDSRLDVIIGGIRQFYNPTDKDLKHFWKKRVNEVEQICDNFGVYTVRSIDGPKVVVEKQKITISNLQTDPDNGEIIEKGNAETIVFDGENKTLTINSRELTIIVDNSNGGSGDCNIKVTGNTTLNVTGNTTVNCSDATITATGTATIEGNSVKLGKDASEAVVKGDAFQSYFSTHTHTTVVGPSGPPIQPFTSDLLSSKVKTE